MLRRIYAILITLLFPVILLRFIIRSRKNSAYRKRLNERLGCVPKVEQPVILLHAVSVGEVMAAKPFIMRLLKRFPNYKIVVTTTTPTGSKQVLQSLPSEIYHSYIPLDVPFAINKFLKRIQPKLVIIMETEIWPNIIFAIKKRKIPMMIANARISPAAFKQYNRFKTFFSSILNNMNVIATQSKVDYQYFFRLGVKDTIVKNIGNIKFAKPDVAKNIEQAKILCKAIGKRPIWVAASTHHGEEEKILDTHQKLLKTLPNALLILVPRHPERFTEVLSLCNKQFKVVKRSSNNFTNISDVQILLGDTMGEMRTFFAAADVAFIAGSLEKIGGHNMLEACQMGAAVLTGPHVFNFQEISDKLIAAGAMQMVADENQLATTLNTLLTDNSARIALVENANAVVAQNAGALAAHLKIVEQLLKEV